MGRGALGLVSLLVLSVTGYGWTQYANLANGIHRSNALGGGAPRPSGGDINILVMGLDSRLDENGHPLPPEIYAALHAGDQQDGGYNANVLMLVHLPGNGTKATVISIPRDDYVSFPGRPDGVAKGIYYPARGLADAARTLAGMLGGLPTAPDAELPVGHLRVILGTDFIMPAALGVTATPAGGPSPTTSTTRTPAGPRPNGAQSTMAESLPGGGIPCVN